MPNFESYCRCPGCGTCDAARKYEKAARDNKKLRNRIAALEREISRLAPDADRRDKASFDDGVIIAAAALVRAHDQPTMAADILRECGLTEHDCSHLEEFDKADLRKINRGEGLALKGLASAAIARSDEEKSQ